MNDFVRVKKSPWAISIAVLLAALIAATSACFLFGWFDFRTKRQKLLSNATAKYSVEAIEYIIDHSSDGQHLQFKSVSCLNNPLNRILLVCYNSPSESNIEVSYKPDVNRTYPKYLYTNAVAAQISGGNPRVKIVTYTGAELKILVEEARK